MIERQPTAPTFNLEDIVTRAKSGDQEAYALLDGFLDRQLGRIFRTFGYRAPDLLQDTKIKVLTNLENFDPDLKERGFDVNFRAWTLTLGLTVRTTELRRMQRQVKQTTFNDNLDYKMPSESQDGDESEGNKTEINYSALLRDKINGLIIKDSQREIVRLSLEGKNNEEIARILGKSKENVANQLFHARGILEKKLIFPTGFRRLVSFADKELPGYGLHTAARRRKIETVRFLNLLYTTQEAVKRYKMTRRPIPRKADESLLVEGYVFLSSTDVSDSEHYALCRSALVLKKGGRVYILPEDLGKFRANRKAEDKHYRILGVTPEGFKPITEFIKTRRDGIMIREDIRAGKLPAVKVDCRWLTTQEAFNEWQTSRKTPMKNNLHF